MNLSYLPNVISGLRIVLVVPLVMLLARAELGAALAVFALAGFSDGLDGYLARRYGWFTKLGGWLDPIADKAMLVSTYVMLGWWLHLIPIWLPALVILRDVVIVTGGLVYYLWVEKVEAEPSWLSKINTVMQILLVMAVMVDHSLMVLPAALLDVLVYGVLVTTVLSGAGYVWVWSRRAVHAKRGIVE